MWPLWIVQGHPPWQGDRIVLPPDRSELPGQLAVCATDVRPEPPSAAPSPGTWCPPAIWSRPHLWRRCSALATSSTRPPPSRGLQGQMLLPKAGVTKLLPDSAVARTRGAGCALFSLFSIYSSCNASSPFGCMRGTRGTQPCSVYRGGRDTPSGRGSVQMCHHSWEQNTQCLQKLRPECTVALPAHGPSRPGLTGLPPWSPWQWDVPRLSPRFLTISQVGVSPTACTGRKVFHLLSPTPPYPAH